MYPYLTEHTQAWNCPGADPPEGLEGVVEVEEGDLLLLIVNERAHLQQAISSKNSWVQAHAQRVF